LNRTKQDFCHVIIDIHINIYFHHILRSITSLLLFNSKIIIVLKCLENGPLKILQWTPLT